MKADVSSALSVDPPRPPSCPSNLHSITEVPVCLDELMGSLRALDLTNNKLEGQLDPITTFFPRLQHLRVGNNQLTAIPDSICQLKDLQVRLQASDDVISDLPRARPPPGVRGDFPPTMTHSCARIFPWGTLPGDTVLFCEHQPDRSSSEHNRAARSTDPPSTGEKPADTATG